MIIKKIIDSLFLEVEDTVDAVFNHKENPESIHAFRVKIRQLRSFLYFVKPLINENNYVVMQTKLKNQSSYFSEIREHHVIIDYWKTFCQSRPELISYPNELSKYFDQKLDEIEKKTYESISSALILTNIKSLQSDEIKFEKIASDKNFEKFCTDRIKEIKKKLSKEISSLDIRDDDFIHKTRIKAKKLRYSLNCIKPYINKDYKRLIKLSKKATELLGGVCDSIRMIDLLNSYEKSDYPKELNYQTGLLVGHLIENQTSLIKKANSLDF
ncbi:CHAD domain-containing protein [Alkalibacter mobilis]|uniref:CHAD domain-containing protein n=1 Tax=Alkalibacter mobilis TaxID=2787712 RepID=UPI00189EAF8C|nr:CHAD domain-containing protein [Alkalibacter mobilis]MBF7097756.1 CHAD domain-containing protein [Alkalibacter mobilis]